jgi:hypothetical protein
MLFEPNHEERLDALQERLRSAGTLTPELMAQLIGDAGLRLQAQHPTARARIVRLIEFGAFADATLALLELELPQWTLRRLVHEDGEWHCALSRQLALPSSTTWPKAATKTYRWRFSMPLWKRGVVGLRPASCSRAPCLGLGPHGVMSFAATISVSSTARVFASPVNQPPLCRPYENGPASLSNSYAPMSTLPAGQATMR